MLDELVRRNTAIEAWEQSGTTGASAKSIVAHLASRGTQNGAYPLDEGDFGRCEHLLDKVPMLREDFALMKDVNAYWAALVDRWDYIIGSVDKTSAIKSTIEPIQKADPSHIQVSKNSFMRIGKNNSSTTVEAMKERTEELRQQKGKPPMKHDPDFSNAQEGTYRVAADELRSFIERVERLDVEKKDIADSQKEVFAEAKSRGYDTKVMRKLITMRKKDPQEIAEEEAVLDLYREALGM